MVLAAIHKPQAAHRLRGPSATDNARTTARGTHKGKKESTRRLVLSVWTPAGIDDEGAVLH